MLACEVNWLISKRLPQDLQCLAQSCGPLGQRSQVQADTRVLVFERAASDAKLKAATRDLVQRGGHLGEYRGMPKLIAQHHMSDLDALGLAEQRGGQGPSLHRRIVGRSRPV